MRKHKAYSLYGCNNCPTPLSHPDDLCEDKNEGDGCEHLNADGTCKVGKTVYKCLEELDAAAEEQLMWRGGED